MIKGHLFITCCHAQTSRRASHTQIPNPDPHAMCAMIKLIVSVSSTDCKVSGYYSCYLLNLSQFPYCHQQRYSPSHRFLHDYNSSSWTTHITKLRLSNSYSVIISVSTHSQFEDCGYNMWLTHSHDVHAHRIPYTCPRVHAPFAPWAWARKTMHISVSLVLYGYVPWQCFMINGFAYPARYKYK